ncbi:Cysteine-rich membrane protein 2 [Spironucleus salmonicida]|uniref:Cysteine-rich membrane protein 2 n=1 Tax=Spironucleus salmonicida TaxID=348837 RepID=V6LIB5_9EUKA|nr:Cysteine-rich membrane protein 2 [Spironucleus salmonicida]|eukprot:EST44282.1 Cysteine-rich membrane protein 2 [Spironucleus salmonicida]
MTCSSIPGCALCNPQNPLLCTKCDNFLLPNAENSFCECTKGSSKACSFGQNCAKIERICIDFNICYGILGCKICDFTNFSKCGECVTGFFVSETGEKCISLEGCKEVENCIKCDESNIKKCSKCRNQLQVIENKCSCFGQNCLDQEICSFSLKKCLPVKYCLDKVQQCTQCDLADSYNCAKCSESFYLNNQFCLPLTPCQHISNCIACDPISTNLCNKCSNGLTISPLKATCECERSTGTPCQLGFSCVKHLHSCQIQNSCQIWPFGVANCKVCSQAEPRICHQCEDSYQLSLDQLKCYKQGECFSISGCVECVWYEGDRCAKCQKGFLVGEMGRTCLCGGKKCTGSGKFRTNQGCSFGVCYYEVLLWQILFGVSIVLLSGLLCILLWRYLYNKINHEKEGQRLIGVQLQEQ